MGRDYLAYRSEVEAHANRKDNPHGVTKSQVGLGNVDNTSDANKPVSTAQAAAIADAKKAGTDAQANLTAHNTNTNAHNDIRVLLAEMSARLNAALDSDDTTLDQMSEVVAYIKSNKALIDSITTSKVNVTDIINNLTTNVSNKPLSAAQGVVLKALIDALQTEVNGKAADDHTHTAAEVGARPSTWMPTAADVGALSVYIDFASIGLTNGSETIEAIANALPNNSMLIADISASCNTSLYPYGEGTLIVTKRRDNRIKFEFIPTVTTGSVATFYNGVYMKAYSLWTGWIECGSAKGYVPLDGSANMTGDFRIEKAYPVMAAKNTSNARASHIKMFDNGKAEFSNYKDENNYRGLRISPETATGADIVELCQMIAGAWNAYKILGEHNKPSGSYAGNSSATTRTITINNVIGTTLLIKSAAAGTAVWLTETGGVAKLNDGTMVAVNSSVAKFVVSNETGTLTINSDARHLNGAYNYNYHVQ